MPLEHARLANKIKSVTQLSVGDSCFGCHGATYGMWHLWLCRILSINRIVRPAYHVVHQPLGFAVAMST